MVWYLKTKQNNEQRTTNEQTNNEPRMAAFGIRGLHFEPREPDMPPPPIHNPFEFFRAQIDLEIARVNANVQIHIANAQVEIARINANARVDIAEIRAEENVEVAEIRDDCNVLREIQLPNRLVNRPHNRDEKIFSLIKFYCNRNNNIIIWSPLYRYIRYILEEDGEYTYRSESSFKGTVRGQVTLRNIDNPNFNRSPCFINIRRGVWEYIPHEC